MAESKEPTYEDKMIRRLEVLIWTVIIANVLWGAFAVIMLMVFVIGA